MSDSSWMKSSSTVLIAMCGSLGLVRGWVAAVGHVGGDALMSSRRTPANKRADAARTTTPKPLWCVSLACSAGLRAPHLTLFEVHRGHRVDLQAVPRSRYASPASVSGIGGNGDPDAMATCAVEQAALGASAMKGCNGAPTTDITSAAMRLGLRIAALQHRSTSMRYNGDRTFCETVR